MRRILASFVERGIITELDSRVVSVPQAPELAAYFAIKPNRRPQLYRLNPEKLRPDKFRGVNLSGVTDETAWGDKSAPSGVTDCHPKEKTDLKNVEGLFPAPFEEIRYLWIDIIGSPEPLPIRRWGPRRRREVWALHVQIEQHYCDPEETPLEVWGQLFRVIARSDFLMGRRDGNRTVSLDWVIKKEQGEWRNFSKVIEGNYENVRDQHR